MRRRLELTNRNSFRMRPHHRAGTDVEAAPQLSDSLAHVVFRHRGAVDQRRPIRAPRNRRFQEIAQRRNAELAEFAEHLWITPKRFCVLCGFCVPSSSVYFFTKSLT